MWSLTVLARGMSTRAQSRSRIVETDLSWQDQAACKGKSETFFVGDHVGSRQTSKFDRTLIEKAKQICHLCPVESVCLTWALDQQIPFFVYGGMSWSERQRFLAEGKSRILVDSPLDAVEA
jgi:WhiB family redox-sensing transcriptional regulator